MVMAGNCLRARFDFANCLKMILYRLKKAAAENLDLLSFRRSVVHTYLQKCNAMWHWEDLKGEIYHSINEYLKMSGTMTSIIFNRR